MKPMHGRKASGANEYVVFRVGEVLCGLEIDAVQEINRNLDLTPVHSAPPFVLGIVNLRGRIVTVVSLRGKLGIAPAAIDGQTRNIVVKSSDEHIGLVVDMVEDIVAIDPNEIAEPPPHLSGQMSDYFAGVYQSREELVAILNTEALLAHRG